MRTLAALLLACAGCSSAAEPLCQSVSDCTTRTEEETSACEAQAKELSTEAARSGCATALDAWFSCAADRFGCRGVTPVSPGCEPARAAAADCLADVAASNACGELARSLSACQRSSPDAGALPPTCEEGGVCAARCWLDAVADRCAPLPAELAAVVRCAKLCPL